MNAQPLPGASVLFAICLMFSCASAPASDMFAKTYDINNVTEVVVMGGGRLQLAQGDTETLQVEAHKDVIDRISVDLSGNKLTLRVKNKDNKILNFFHWFDNEKYEATYILQLKHLNYLVVSGASHATLGNWSGQQLNVKASGAAEVNFANLALEEFLLDLSGASNSNVQELKAAKAKFDLSGAANVNVKAAGQATFASVGASGASNFRGKLLSVAQADVDASGASTIELNVSESLKADASGASNVRYLGQPKVQGKSSGASHVSSL